MRLFLATDALDDVRWATARALIDGVVLPDAALHGASTPSESLTWLGDFARAAAMPVFVALNATSAALAAEEAERLGRVADHVVIQLPFADPYIPLMHRLASTGVRVAATYVGSASQAMLAARTGAAFLFVDVDRIHAAGADAAATVSHARRLLDASAAEADLVAVFPAPGAALVECALAGAHAAVVGTAALRALAAYPFTDQSLMDGARRPTHGEKLRVNPS